jgi:hypothetical protein
VAEAVSLLHLLEALESQLRSRISMTQTMIARKINTREFIEELRGYDGRELLMLPAAD